MPFTICATALHHVHAPGARTIKTSWGTMGERHAIFVGLQDEDGHWGWGESWVNFPTWSPWERLAAFEQAYLPYVTGRVFDDISADMAAMGRAFVGPAVQADTVGALIASLCAVELALWDLVAQRRGVPLGHLWFDAPAPAVRVYASGINAPLPWDDIDAMRACGVDLFKLKIGFGDEDLVNLAALRRHLGDGVGIAVDVNRHWTIDEALAWLPVLRDHDVRWVEEALRPEHESHYGRLRAVGLVPLSAGENAWVRPGVAPEVFAALDVDILQPDITKNCGLAAAVAVLQRARADGRRLIPHFLGSAIGQAASLHLASGCSDAWVEWDINPNPLRSDLLGGDFAIVDGSVRLGDAPGLGWAFDPNRLAAWR